MRGVLDVASRGIDGWLRNRHTDRGLEFTRVRLRRDSVEVEVHQWLVNAREVLRVSERDQATVAEATRLVRCKLGPCTACAESYEHTNRISSQVFHDGFLSPLWALVFWFVGRRAKRQAQQILNQVTLFSIGQVQLQQRQRHHWIIEVDSAALDMMRQIAVQRVDVDLRSERERGLRT